MKTRLLITYLILSILFASLISYADARGFSPFHFRLADEIVYNDLYFYVDGSKSNFRVDKGETATLPLIITSKHSVGTVVDFHATIDNDQMGEIRFPPGVNIQLEPNQMTLNGQNQTLNVTVHVSEKAPSSKYNVNLVGVWQEEGKIPDFIGTGFSLHVGRDFGNDAIPVNFFEPPLKFVREGVEPKDIPCRNALVLILRYDGAPSCVHEDTKPRLIERGWTKTQVDVHSDEAFIEGTKKLDAVQYFLSLYPDAKISIDKEWYTVTYAESGFIEEDPSRYEPIRTKKLIIHLDYDGKLMPFSIECGGPVSLSIHGLDPVLEHLHNPDWCFPFDQSQFDSFDKEDLENKIPLSTSDEYLKSKAYIENCDETIHKEELPDLTIENSTHNYDMQYCKWELKYPDLTLIDNVYLLNDYPYCAELFDTLFDYYQSIRDPCGMQRYNEDGTPRGVCEPAPAGAGVPYDINMIKSGCIAHYADWAYQTKHNDDVFYLFDRKEINNKIHGNLDEQIKVIDKLCKDNDYLSVKPNIKFRNNTHWIDTDNCTLNIKEP
jgi:hypothetical protein